MPDLLLELFSEEIPARMQVQAAKDLERLVVGALSDRGLLFEGSKGFAGPRRLTLAVQGLPAKQADVSEERKGPRVNAPEKAIEGFLKSTGISLAQCEKRADPKGDFYVAMIHRKGRPTSEVLAEILPEAIAKLPWPKSMRWPQGEPSVSFTNSAGQPVNQKGDTVEFRSTVRWVRPLHEIVATLDGQVMSFEFASVLSGHTTWGHRFLSSGPIEVKRFDDYIEKLRAGHVILDAAERREIILNEARTKAFALGLEVVQDEGLANEVMGLAEWPVVLIGTIDDEFLDLPPEILQTSMRTHQKYFALRDPETGKLANRFAVVANMAAEDGGRAIVVGNERVLRARLSDAKFFWDQDRKMKLSDRVDALRSMVFHAKLGTQFERVQRIEELSGEIASIIGADVSKAKWAARLCKADLTTGVVGEFPELQGIMGRYYALNDGEDGDVANAIRDHYKPLGPSDLVPAAPISIAVALADKLDTLIGFFTAKEKPTGSGDPFALRRAALGVTRILLGGALRLDLQRVFRQHGVRVANHHMTDVAVSAQAEDGSLRLSSSIVEIRCRDTVIERFTSEPVFPDGEDVLSARRQAAAEEAQPELLAFFADRLKVALRDKGVRHDLIDAVFALGNEDDLVRLVRRVEALQAFLKTDDGVNLLTGYRRAANILKIEEKKDKKEYRGVPIGLRQEEEQELQAALVRAKVETAKALSAEDFKGALSALAAWRVPVDRFFDKVTVNSDDKLLRENRLKLLSQIVETAHQVADFSKVEG
jgi:glycyl-tRNA synthetase beta chain